MQVLSNSVKLAWVVGTRMILLNSNNQLLSSLTQFSSSPLSSLQFQLRTKSSSATAFDSYDDVKDMLFYESWNHFQWQSYWGFALFHSFSSMLFGFYIFSLSGHRAAVATADVCDSNAALLVNGDLRALDPIFKIYGRRLAFSGPIVTVKVFEDNVLVRQLLETEGNGRVLVIDGGGSTRCALVGGNLAQWAHDMAWAGIIVNSCIRDVDEINACDIGVRALGSNPLKSNKKAVGDKHVPVQIAGTLIHDGEWLYADSDGILISKTELSV
ncbi:hypothetical protein ERO13_D09G060900v2 [Gossypium hirsutum]|nr:hypothetical protein ERO13_D09G060900v2 [Gossypium hirsutum]